ncbi:serine/threonine-protein kinase DDB_G0283821-like isoform X2 [Contarinia nasturtii]|nr:serine/threonine-protein kinase DDB_G0283821-like isoform X2 [Contarinia nasturtii]XP_031633082.1 serine/threonine-protein kinase DDB_G0283821-like isoform X2 [Contarinia nasturtii]
MGNNLCRERIARADNSKSPIDRIIGRCAQICPANEVKSNYWQKHVLETGPPTRSQPQSLNDGWRKVTLTVPNGKMSDDSNLGETPVAPPRRKRSSVIDRQPCGFKELFGNNVSRRSSCDSILKDDHPLSEREQEMLQQKRKSKSISDFNLNEIKPTDSLTISTIRIPVTRTLSLMERSMVQQTTIPTPRPTLQRKISRVGNRKSDKFFGENLSDCLSDDPITPEPEPTSISFTYHTISTLITPISHDKTIESKDKLDEFIDSNVSNNETKSQQDKTDASDITITSPKPFIIGDHIESKQIIGDNKKSSLDKKAEFLMAMLEGNNSYKPMNNDEPKSPPRRSYLKKRNSQFEPVNNNNQESVMETKTITDNNANKIQPTSNVDDNEEYYNGMTPVDEPLIVPRKRPTKHICDDDDHHIHKHIEHNHGAAKENNTNAIIAPMKDEDIEKYIIMQVTNSPEKPKRDLSVYEKSNKAITANLTTSNTPVEAPATKAIIENNDAKIPKAIPRVRHLSQENLMPKKMVSSKSNDTLDLMRIKSMQNNNNNNNNPNFNDERLESILKRYTSQQSFFTKELLSQIADRVYGFQDPFDMNESGDDGSLNCTPNSKLTTRKISAHRKESTVSRPILENECEVKSIETAPPKIVEMEHKSVKAISNGNVLNGETTTKENTNNATNEDHPILKKIDEKIKRDTEDFLSIERKSSEECNGTETEVNGNENMSETLVASAQDSMNKIPTHSDGNNAVSDVLDDIYKNNNKILNEFQKNLNDITLIDPNKNCDKSENADNSDDENTDSDITVKEVPANESIDLKAENKMLSQMNGAGEKRSSIVEVDAWFLKHNNDLLNLPRRGSETYSGGYDTRKVYPFGKSDPGAGTEFFESKPISKSAEDILNDNVSKVEQNGNLNEHPSTTDHSILLKYLK